LIDSPRCYYVLLYKNVWLKYRFLKKESCS
jgi:hypothetical protein